MTRKILALSVAILIFSGCASLKGKSPASTEQNLASVMDVVSGQLDVAVAYYAAQKTACSKPSQPTCRFSIAGLESFRSDLLKANNLFALAANDFMLYQKTKQNLPQVQGEVMNAAASVATLPKEAR